MSQCLVVKGFVHDSVRRHSPRSFGAVCGLQQTSSYTQFTQMPPSPSTAVPSLPEATPDVPTDPALGVEDVPAFLGQTVIGPPASDVSAPAVTQLFTAQTLAASPHLPHLVFHSLHTLRSRLRPPLPVNAEPKELPLPGSSRTAFASVHFQTQFFFDPLGNTAQHSLRCSAAAHVDIAVVRITAECQSAPFEFPIQRVQIDVRQ